MFLSRAKLRKNKVSKMSVSFYGTVSNQNFTMIKQNKELLFKFVYQQLPSVKTLGTLYKNLGYSWIFW